MSYFDDASLVMIPSGYKDQKIFSVKPLDGSGDLTFSRASSATRVASNGLIEKVRTNLALQSETFDNASWVKDSATITANTIANPLNGAITADTWTATADPSFLFQGVALSAGEISASIFAKANASSVIRMDLVTSGFAQGASLTFNLANGTAGTITQYGSASGFVAKVENYGSGWYRISITGNIVSGTYSSQFYIGSGSVYIYGNQIEYGVVTDYIATTSAAVSVGPVSGLPRLDYLNSSCPRLLLEPSRTSLVTFSENFDNAAWIKTATTITANNAVSPDGYTNADLLLETAATSNHAALSALISFVSGTTYTMSVFAKNISGGRGLLQIGGYQLAGSLQDTFANFNLATGVVTQQTQSTAKIENYGNGWYRCSVTFACTNTISERLNVTLINSGTAGFSASYAGDITKGIYVWGAQMEAGAYATSYIPTLGTSVTRVAEVTNLGTAISLTSDFTLFWEGTALESDLMIYGSGNSTWYANILGSAGRVVLDTNTGRKVQGTSASLTVGTKAKIAIRRQGGAHNIFVNGVKLTNQVSVNDTTTLSLSSMFWGVSSTFYKGQTVNQSLIFKTALTDSQAIELTTI
jgi:hypothetical protein